MIFRNFLENAAGSYAKIKVLRYLLAETLPASENEVARILDLSPMTVNRVMKDFLQINLVSPSKIGTSTAWRINKNSWSFHALEPIKEIKSAPIKDLTSLLTFADHGIVSEAYLFGSVAERTEESASDIDILIIVDTLKNKSDKKLRAYLEHLSGACAIKFGNMLSAKILSKKEIADNKKLEENAKGGIRLK